MNRWLPKRATILAMLLNLAVCCSATADDVVVGDAFARSESDGARWTIGSSGVEQVFESSNGVFGLKSYKNKLTQPATEYVASGTLCAPFAIDVGAIAGTAAFQDVWSKTIAPKEAADPSDDKLTLDVKAGDLIGFCVSYAGKSFSEDDVAWTSHVAYVDGPTYTSSDDAKLEQGPVWFFYERATGTGSVAPLGEVHSMDFGAGAKPARMATGYRAAFEAQGVSATHFGVRNFNTLIRAWKAPKDGRVTIGGRAQIVKGQPVRVSIARMSLDSPNQPDRSKPVDGWRLQEARAAQVDAGGRPAVQLEITLVQKSLRARLRVVAYPGTPILRQWVTLENTGDAATTLNCPAAFLLPMDGDRATSYAQYWLDGGTSRPNQGLLEKSAITPRYHHSLLGEESDNLVPWTAFLREGDKADGCFVAVDALSTWNISVDRDAEGPMMLSVGLPSLANRKLAAGQSLELPVATTGVFHRNLDDMAMHVYDWQYEYLWDYTNPDYYAKSKWAVQIFYSPRNLQEQYTARLGWLDMDIDLMRTLGAEMLWDDAGWAKHPTWPIPDSYATFFTPSMEGADFAETLRYLGKSGGKWLVWMFGRPPLGELRTKIGSWGNFQWRTDGVHRFDPDSASRFMADVRRFLDEFPRASFHTCDGGSRYSHLFEIQRLADVNYLSDNGRGEQIHHYFSYLELPDKWTDMIEVYAAQNRFRPEIVFGQLATTPTWYGLVYPSDRESFRHLMDLYHYLRSQGVAGRWSYMMHPTIQNDVEFFYDQRLSYDRTKSCIILKHRSPCDTTIFPRGLLPKQSYDVAYELTRKTSVRTGEDLMTNGIAIKKEDEPIGVIYLNLPNRPGGGRDAVQPIAPGQVLLRPEANIGYRGVGIYWSAGSDNNWISFYEIQRDGKTIGKASVGQYYFDRAPGWDVNASYAVRTVDGDGNPSGWTPARRLAGGQQVYAALGAHSGEIGRDGWKAETTADGQHYAEAKWVPPAKSPGADFGGTPNQSGGVEGYWEGATGARLGRGWQQAAPDAACVRTWVAPRSGRVRVTGRAMKEFWRQKLGTALQVRIQQNDRVVWPQTEPWAAVPLGDLYGAAHDIAIDVQQGDALRFVLDRSSDPSNAIVAWMPRIYYLEDAQPTAESASQSRDAVRILCGASSPYQDHNGNVWSADRCFTGGSPMSTDRPIEDAQPTAEDAPLYAHGRSGEDFRYAIPAAPGVYAVRLKFAEPKYVWSFERPFNVSIQGRNVMTNADICHLARGPRKAYDKVFHYVVPNADGKIDLRFFAGFEPSQKSREAMIQAIEVLPEVERPSVRIDCGSPNDFVDWHSVVWSKDNRSDVGRSIASNAPVAQASPTIYDQGLYQTARTGKEIVYRFQLPPSLYSVHLKFAELWLTELGKRPMDVEVNGRTVRKSWDPANSAGRPNMSADVRVEDVAPDARGEIVVRVRAAGPNDAILQGIEIE